MARRAAMLVLATLVLYPGLACRRAKSPAQQTAPRLRLGAIDVREVVAGEPDAPPLDVEAIGRLIRKTLLQSELFLDGGDTAAAGAALPDGSRSSVPAGPTVRARANVGVEFAEVADRGVVRTAVRIKLDTRPSDAPGAVEDDLSAGGERLYAVTPTTDRARLAQESVERTTADLLSGFVARGRLATATAAELHATITADAGAPGLREEAIRTIGARQVRGEAPLLLKLLEHENEATRDAALGALIALEDTRAVGVLTRSRSLRDRHEMRKILDAIATLGGEEAREYLSFVAESHDDEEIRKLAADARARLERRAQTKPK